MTTKFNRRKPGFTRSGEVKIISLSVSQLIDLKTKTQSHKKQAKIQRRIDLLKSRGNSGEPTLQVNLE